MLVIIAPAFLSELVPSEFHFLPFFGTVLVHVMEVPVRDERRFNAEVVACALELVADGLASRKVDNSRIALEVEADCHIRSVLVSTLGKLDFFNTGHVLGGVLVALLRHEHVIDLLAEIVFPLAVRNRGFTLAVRIVVGVCECRPPSARVSKTVTVFEVVDNVGLCTVSNTCREAAVARAAAVLEVTILIAARSVHPALDHVTRSRKGKAVVDSEVLECSGLFLDSGSRPVSPRNVVLVHPVDPRLTSALVRRAVTVGADRTPFRSKHRNAGRHSLSSTVIVTAVTCLVRCSVEVERATEVFLAVLNARLSALFRMAGPFRAAHEHEVVGILTDCGNHGVRMRGDRTHVGTDRFVPDFENHVVVFAIFLGGIFEELDSFRSIAVCTFDVPVDNHVDVVFDGGIDHVLEVAFLQGFALRAAQVATALVLELFLSHAHCKADDFDVHLLHHGVHGLFGIENGRAICTRTPEEAHALDLDGLVGVIRASTGKLAAICLKFTISAYRPSTVSTNCHSRRYGSAHQKCEDLFHKHPFGFTQSPQPYNPI